MCAVLAFTLSTLSVTAEAVSIPTARSGTQAKMLVPVGRASLNVDDADKNDSR